MSGKGSRKSPKASKKCPREFETFACDLLSYVLLLCGLPKEKIKSMERKQNAYRDGDEVLKSASLVLNSAISKRDEWKTMFESRLKTSGLSTPEEIEKLAIDILGISNEFRNGNPSIQIHLSIAVYSEIMLFLNYKGVEFDFERMLSLWISYFMEVIAQNYNANHLLMHIFAMKMDPTNSIKWITNFLQDVGSPYGSRDDVSEVYRLSKDRVRRDEDEEISKLAESLTQLITQRNKDAEESAAVLPPGFESSVVLPGDSKSPEPSETCDSSVRRKDKKSRRRSSRSTGVSNLGFEGRQRSKTASELELEERPGLANLSNEDSPKKNKEKQRKPNDRQSY